MNFLINIICFFILNKDKRKNFRRKYRKNKYKKYEEYVNTILNNTILNNTILNNTIISKIKFNSYLNVNKILSLKDKYKGQKCFIIGGSPSLKDLDLSKLNNSEYKIFTTGRGYKLKENNLLKSNFHILSDILGYEEIIDEIDENFADLFFSYCELNFRNNVKDLIYFDIFNTYVATMEKHYQEDLTRPLFHCETVVNYALQIATYMGFKDIYFIGVDLDFSKNSGHVYESSNGEKARQIEHSVKKSSFMLSSFEYATPFLKQKGVNLYNASPSGILNCMPRINYNELFNNK